MAQEFDFSLLRYRTEKFLEGVSDGTLAVLKGHLLFEEVLYAKVCAKCPNPDFIEKAQLRFVQLLNVARALYPPPEGDTKERELMQIFWDAAEALNTLRNRLAHRLEPKDISPLLKRLQIRPRKGPVSLGDPKLADALGNSIAMFLGFAAALGTVEEQQAGQEEPK